MDKKIKVLEPGADPEMFHAPDHKGVEALTKPYHYRGQIFGVGSHVDSVLNSIERWNNLRAGSLASRVLPQSFGLSIEQIVELQELSKTSGQSMSQLAREAVAALLKQKETSKS